MHEVLVNRLGGLSLPRKSVVRLTDRPDMTLDVYRGRKTTMQQQQQLYFHSRVKVFTSAKSTQCTFTTSNNQPSERNVFARSHYVICSSVRNPSTKLIHTL